MIVRVNVGKRRMETDLFFSLGVDVPMKEKKVRGCCVQRRSLLQTVSSLSLFSFDFFFLIVQERGCVSFLKKG